MITGIILAAGLSKRMGKQKLLLEVEDAPMIQRVIQSIVASKVDEVVLIYNDERVKEIGILNKLKLIHNTQPELGQSLSVKMGIQKASKKSKGYIFFMGDQPFLNTETINRIIEIFNNHGDSIIVPRYKGKRGNPVLFSSRFKNDLLRIEGDKGGRKIIEDNSEKVVFVDFHKEYLGMDMDIWDIYCNYKDGFHNT